MEINQLPAPAGMLFDLDGTLVDTGDDITHHLNKALADFALPALTRAEILQHVGFGAPYLVEHTLEKLQVPAGEREKLVPRVLNLFRSRYEKEPVVKARLYPGTRELLTFLRNHQIALGVVSNKPRPQVRKVISHFKLEEYFKFAWGREDVSHPKPDPRAVAEAADRLLVSGTIWFVGDSQADLEAALGAGAVAVGVLHGFFTKDILSPLKPHLLVNDFIELLHILKKKLL